MTSRSIVNCFKKMVLFQAQDRSSFPTVSHTKQTVQLGSEYDAFFQRDEAKLKALREQLANKRIGSETWQKTIARVCSKGLNPRAVNPFHVNGRQVCNMPKFPAIFQSICASLETRIVVYSNFRDSGVVGFFDWICSEQNFRKTSKHAIHSCVKTLDGGRKMEVALWDNDLCKELSKWQKQDSDGLKVLLLSPMAREGVSLKGVRVLHLMEPSWNATDEEQAIGRASRLTSHTHLSPDQRNVTVTKWTALYKPGKRTSDERVASLGAEKERFLEPVRKKLKIVGEQAVKSLSA
jgi:hypothetical protein